jgi:hypothetical protein
MFFTFVHIMNDKKCHPFLVKKLVILMKVNSNFFQRLRSSIRWLIYDSLEYLLA